jgi:septin family protein
MQDLKDYTQDVHYENFRKKKLLQASPGRKVSEYQDYGAGGGSTPGTPEDAAKAAALKEKEKELEDMRRQMALLQAQLRGAQQSDAV